MMELRCNVFSVLSDHSIRTFVYEAFGLEPNVQKFPGAMPSTLMRADLPKLCGHTSPYVQYVVSPKVDGERALIAVLQNGAVFAIDRAMKITELSGITLPPASLFDVERADGTVWVFDAVMVAGKNLRNLPYHHRMQLAGNAISDRQMLRMKPFFTDRIPATWDGFGQVDGLVFTPVTKPVTPFRNTEMLKWKPLEQQTVDLRWHIDGTLRAIDQGAEAAVSIMPGMQAGDQGIWECHAIDDVWIPVKPRKDRAEPNALFVVDAVTQCIRENITLAELHTLFDTR